MAPECSYLVAVVITVMVVEMVHKIGIKSQILKTIETVVITPTSPMLATMLGRTLRKPSNRRMMEFTIHLALTPTKIQLNNK